MAESTIIKGTTPTIKFTFSTIDGTEINNAYLTIRQGDTEVVEKGIDTATRVTDYISWQLTQEESLKLSTGKAKFMLNWLLNDGTRGASKEYDVKVTDNYVDETMPLNL